MPTSNLDITQVAAAQNNKEVTINDALDKLDLALTDFVAVDVSGGDVTITNDDFRQNICLAISGGSATQDVTVPAVKRLFIADNQDGTYDHDIVRGTTNITLGSGEAGLFYTDGTTNGLVAVASGSGGGGGSTTFDGLTDTSFAALANGDFAQWNGSTWVNINLATSTSPANDQFRGARVTLTADETGISGNSYHSPTFDDEVYDTDSFWDNSNRQRFTIPTGVTKVRMLFEVQCNAIASSSGWAVARVSRNTTEEFRDGNARYNPDDTVCLKIDTGVVEVTAGDYFDLEIYVSEAWELDANSFMSLEIVEMTGYGVSPYTFLGLTDVTETSYAGKSGQVATVNTGETGIEFTVAGSGGSTTYTGLTDTPADFTGDAGKIVRVNTGETAVEHVVQPRKMGPLGLFVGGVPGNLELVALHIVVEAFTLPASLTGSRAYAVTAATAAASFDLQKNGSSIGSVDFAIGSNTGTFTHSSATSFAIGDRLSLVNQASADATLADIAVTFVLED